MCSQLDLGYAFVFFLSSLQSRLLRAVSLLTVGLSLTAVSARGAAEAEEKGEFEVDTHWLTVVVMGGTTCLNNPRLDPVQRILTHS